jgi:hypothetical protein
MINAYVFGYTVALILWFRHETDDRYWQEDGFLSIIFNPFFWPVTIWWPLYYIVYPRPTHKQLSVAKQQDRELEQAMREVDEYLGK